MRSRLTVAVVAVACLVGAPGGAWALEETVPPVGTDHEMTLAELRYCIFQGVRLKSANDALDASSRLEIDRFNEWVDDWNARCASYRHLPSDLDAAETSAVLKRIQLETEGKALVIGLRTARAASVYHVTASALNLRAGPDPSQSIIGRLERFEDLRATGPTLGEWLPVEVDGMAGYVARAYVMQGSGEAPRRAYCRSIAGARPENGEILAGEGNGRHVVRVTNGHAKDVQAQGQRWAHAARLLRRRRPDRRNRRRARRRVPVDVRQRRRLQPRLQPLHRHHARQGLRQAQGFRDRRRGRCVVLRHVEHHAARGRGQQCRG